MSLASTALLLAVIVLVVRLAFVWWLRVRRMGRVSASIPGPRPYPIVGNFFDVARGSIRRTFTSLLQEYGYLIRIWVGPLLIVFVFDAEDLEVVMSSQACSNKPKWGYELTIPLGGKGLLVLNGADNRRHRKLIMPTLHREMLDQLQPLMQMAALDTVKELRHMAATGEVFQAHSYCGKVSVDATYRTILNADEDLFEAHRDLRQWMVHHSEFVSEMLTYRLKRPWLWMDRFFRWDPHFAEFNDALNRFDQVVWDVMDYKLGKKGMEAPAEKVRPRRRQAFLDHFVASAEMHSITLQELHDELKTMVIGSFATSMDALASTVVLLSLLPEIQEKIHCELDEVFGDSDRPLELSDLDHLVYLERVIKECLRYAPPIPMFARTCTEDVKLPSGHVLPAGCITYLSPVATHRNPKYFADPERFDPDRFLPEAVSSRPSCSFMPFSAGPRGCIGVRYALMFLKTVLANVLRCYTLLPDPEGPKDIRRIKMRMGFSYFPVNGSRIRLRSRTVGRSKLDCREPRQAQINHQN